MAESAQLLVPQYDTGTYAHYNQWTGATWQKTEIVSSDYYNVYLVAVPSISSGSQIVVIPAQTIHVSLALAQAAKIADEISWGGSPDSVPFAEFCIIHRFTLRSGSSYTQLGKVRIEAYKDLRGKTTRVSVQSGVV